MLLSSFAQVESVLTHTLRLLLWAFSAPTTTVMNPVFIENAFWISATVNMSTLLFFMCRSCIGAIGRRYYAEGPNDYRRSLYELHDDKKWYISRFLVGATQSALLSILGLTLLTQGKVIHRPFYGLNQLSRICFAINIGCYIYRIAQDGILHRHLSKVSVDAVHHVVTVSVYAVFLMYEQNALFGTLGMLFAVTTPFIEVRRLLKSAGLERYSKFSGINLLVCCILTILVRLVVPASLIIWSLIHGSPLTMDVVVVAIYFLSAIFFGILNLWLVVTAITAVFKFWHKQRTCKLERILGAGKPHGLEIESSDRCRFTTKRNDLNLMIPCSNANIAPHNAPTVNQQRCNIPTKSYHKANMTELLNHPGVAAASRGSPGPSSASDSSVVRAGVPEGNTNVQITNWDRSSTSWDNPSGRSTFPFQNVITYTDRSRASTTESSSSAGEVETVLGSHSQANNRHFSDSSQVEGARTYSESHSLESDSLFSEGPKSRHDYYRESTFSDAASPSTSTVVRPDRTSLTRSMSNGTLDHSNIYNMQMAIMREHVLNIQSNNYDFNDARNPFAIDDTDSSSALPMTQATLISADVIRNDVASCSNGSS